MFIKYRSVRVQNKRTNGDLKTHFAAFVKRKSFGYLIQPNREGAAVASRNPAARQTEKEQSKGTGCTKKPTAAL